MNFSLLAAGAFAAALIVGATSASAADFDEDRYSRSHYSDRYSSAYEDQRYRDIYGPAPSYARPFYAPPKYYKTEPAPYVLPPAYVHRGRPYDYDGAEFLEDPRIGRPADRHVYRESCLPREEIRRRLLDEGWREFRDVAVRGNIAKVQARRRGEFYMLKIDRCTGDVVDARLFDGADRGPYAFEPGPYRTHRPYY